MLVFRRVLARRLISRGRRGLVPCSRHSGLGPRPLFQHVSGNVFTRRTLFDLHAGRDVHPALAEESIDKVENPTPKDDGYSTTSQMLIDALGDVGLEYMLLRQYNKKIDLSHTNAYTALMDPTRARQEAQEKGVEAAELGAKDRLHLKSAMVDFLRILSPHLEDEIQQPGDGFDEQWRMPGRLDHALEEFAACDTFQWLKEHGWDVTDLMNWAWVLQASTAEESAFRLQAIMDDPENPQEGAKKVPNTFYIFLLKRRDFSARALQVLILHAWKVVDHAVLPLYRPYYRQSLRWNSYDKVRRPRLPLKFAAHPRNHPSGIMEVVFMIMIIRLMRHARKKWPAALIPITAMFCQFYNGHNFLVEPDDNVAKMSFAYNSVLKLVAVPASLQPFISATHQRKAQFDILRRMSQFDPPLIVDRRGYQAVTQLQLMMKKALRERDWALLKAKSWPPWKADRTGIDASIEADYGVSAARAALDQAEVAGYPSKEWEESASILSGWDTDKTPTIQTRRILSTWEEEGRDPSLEGVSVWRSRIRATRTAYEAWAIFEQCKLETEVASHELIYEAVLEKLIFASRLASKEVDGAHPDNPEPDVLPGDTIGVSPEPRNPSERIFVRGTPAEVEDFIHAILDGEVDVGPALLRTILTGKISTSLAVQALLRSTLPHNHKFGLLCDPSFVETDKQLDAAGELLKVPMPIFDSFLIMLTYATPISRENVSEVLPKNNADDIQVSHQIFTNPMQYAFKLMRARRPQNTRTWYHLLSGLSRNGLGQLSPNKDPTWGLELQLRKWEAFLRILEIMDELHVQPDLDLWWLICVLFERAVVAQAEMAKVTDRPGGRAVPGGLVLIKEMFLRVVQADKPKEETVMIDTADFGEATMQDDEAASIEEDAISPPTVSKPQTFISPSSLMPNLLEVPQPIHIHQLIRVFGMLRDYEGILDLLEWASMHWEDIHQHLGESVNGQKKWRRCIVAVRVYMEWKWLARGKWATIGGDEAGRVSPEVKLAIRDTIDNTEGWGGWPSGQEMNTYRGHGPSATRQRKGRNSKPLRGPAYQVVYG